MSKLYALAICVEAQKKPIEKHCLVIVGKYQWAD